MSGLKSSRSIVTSWFVFGLKTHLFRALFRRPVAVSGEIVRIKVKGMCFERFEFLTGLGYNDKHCLIFSRSAEDCFSESFRSFQPLLPIAACLHSGSDWRGRICGFESVQLLESALSFPSSFAWIATRPSLDPFVFSLRGTTLTISNVLHLSNQKQPERSPSKCHTSPNAVLSPFYSPSSLIPPSSPLTTPSTRLLHHANQPRRKRSHHQIHRRQHRHRPPESPLRARPDPQLPLPAESTGHFAQVRDGKEREGECDVKKGD